jgi:propionyl-CoA synthetase
VEWAEAVKVPVIDHWWRPRPAGIASNPVAGMLPVSTARRRCQCRYQVDVVDEAAKPVAAGTMGSIVIKLPMPPACLQTLWQREERFKAYLSLPRLLQDLGCRLQDEDGYALGDGPHRRHHHVAGHRLSTGGMEEIPPASGCRRMRGPRRQDAIKGEVPLRFLVLKAVWRASPPRSKGDRGAGAQLRPVAAFKLAITVSRYRRTRSGKILRGTIKKTPMATPGPCRDDRGSQGARRNRRR